MVGAASLQSAWAADSDILVPKVWDVSATLRGFYDDNYNIGGGRGSFGVELNPSISINVPLQQTDVGLRYIYGLYYYNDRDSLGLNPFDQTHQVDMWLDHAFNTRWKLNVRDSFVVGQEPELLGPTDPATGNAQQYRISGNNIANHASVSLNTDWTRQFSTSLHYGNDFYDYDNSGGIASPVASAVIPAVLFPVGTPGRVGFQQLTDSNGNPIAPTYAGLLNRVEQSASLDLQWHFQPETMGFLGYAFSIVNYTGNEPVGVFNYLDASSPTPRARGLVYYSNSRDSITHYGYVGVQHQFTPNLAGTVKGGVSYTDNYNDPLQTTTSLSPYADLNLTYTYLPGSYLQVGFTHDINATDVASVNTDTGSLTQYQESSVIYADINHRFTPKLSGTIIARDQISDYQGGANSSSTDSDYSIGLDLSYEINRYFSVSGGYNYDFLQSDIPGRGYSRNRVYLGITASY